MSLQIAHTHTANIQVVEQWSADKGTKGYLHCVSNCPSPAFGFINYEDSQTSGK